MSIHSIHRKVRDIQAEQEREKSTLHTHSNTTSRAHNITTHFLFFSLFSLCSPPSSLCVGVVPSGLVSHRIPRHVLKVCAQLETEANQAFENEENRMQFLQVTHIYIQVDSSTRRGRGKLINEKHVSCISFAMISLLHSFVIVLLCVCIYIYVCIDE
jgi:hypothetical protein